MKRVLRLLAMAAVPVFLVAGCGDDDDGGGGGGRDALISSIADEISADGSVSDEDAECVAESIVDEVGADRLIDMGLDNPDADFDELPEEDSGEILDAVFGAMSDCDIDISSLGG